MSRFPSSDVDLAFVVDDGVPAAALAPDPAPTRRESSSSHWRSSTSTAAPGMPDGTRSLAYRLRLCASDRTLTDEEVAEVRARCIAAVEQAHGAACGAEGPPAGVACEVVGLRATPGG